MQTPDGTPSFLTPIGYENNSCGYCHSKANSFSYYASTTSLTPAFYQSLLDRGWRRSGRLLYKPDLRASCCPQYTIRLDANSFHPSKDQRQSLNRLNKHILGDGYVKEASRLYPLSREQAKKRNTEFDLVERVHESELQQLRTPPEPAHTLSVTLETDEFTDEKYTVFENYQRIVHHEPPSRISKHGFTRFLCSSPLTTSRSDIDRRERKLGSYHQCYRIDGKLVAVGVLDLLPQCVSAVYFMYDESVHQHGFGKIGALREIALAKEDGYNWWYAGFYIHNCVKMKYKGDYHPQYVLDPESYDWNLLDNGLKKKLDKKKYISLSSEALREDVPPVNESDAEMAEATEQPSNSDNASVDSDDSCPPNPDLPLFSRGMSGILTKDQLLANVDLDHIKLRIRAQEAETCDLVSWEDSDINDSHSIKGLIAELACAVGPQLSREMTVSFG
ncbi:arginine-tRNA-protein transferase-like protein 1 [Tricladium varicosporioides]|nr:arginine-tRNA-protein transferase-like protein 1 [Hymenoscyphus varicosporioides]